MLQEKLQVRPLIKIRKPYIIQELNENYVNAGKSWLGIQRGEYQNCPICGLLLDRNYIFEHIEQDHQERKVVSYYK